MPKESGVRFYRDVKGDPELKDIPIIIITALTGYGYDPEGFHKFIKSRKRVPPPEGFMSKPVDTKELLELVKKHI
jgi:CheY-like chemotaxis protein